MYVHLGPSWLVRLFDTSNRHVWKHHAEYEVNVNHFSLLTTARMVGHVGTSISQYPLPLTSAADTDELNLHPIGSMTRTPSQFGKYLWRYNGETLLHSGEKLRSRRIQTKYILTIKAPGGKQKKYRVASLSTGVATVREKKKTGTYHGWGGTAP